jgi:hypothetical protein
VPILPSDKATNIRRSFRPRRTRLKTLWAREAGAEKSIITLIIECFITRPRSKLHSCAHLFLHDFHLPLVRPSISWMNIQAMAGVFGGTKTSSNFQIKSVCVDR